MDVSRYHRQILLPDFGISSQEMLARSSVLVVGAGGLGCPVLQILVSSGVGRIGIMDFDTVEIHNLHRQFLFDEEDVGSPKANSAEKALKKKNSETDLIVLNQQISNSNVISVCSDYDVVVDCTDNFATRYLINDACYLLKKPLVYGSIYRYEGQVSVFNVLKNDKMTNYRDLFPSPPSQNEVPNCNEAGVMPAHSSVIGTFQANEVIKVLTGDKNILAHKLLVFNTKNYESIKIDYDKSESASGPKSLEELIEYNYETFCSICQVPEISNLSHLESFLIQKDAILIDVREKNEQPRLAKFKVLEIPLKELSEKLDLLKSYKSLIFVCASGTRSRKAAEVVKKHFPNKEIKHFPSGVKSIES